MQRLVALAVCAALAVFTTPALAQGTIDAEELFQYGLLTMQESQRPGRSAEEREALLDEAIAAFHTMLVGRPDLVRVRLELARALFMKGGDRLAKQHFEAVLASNPPPPVRANIQQFLNQIRARKRWTVNLGFALAPDTNIGAVSEGRTVNIPVFGTELPFVLDDPEEVRSGVGISVWAGWEYQHPSGPRTRIRLGADIQRREYEGSDFDQMTASVHAGPRWLLTPWSEASLLMSARQHWAGTAPQYHDLGGRLELNHRFSGTVTGDLRLSMHDRRYRERDDDESRDGPIADLSFGGSWVVRPTVRADLSLGYSSESPETERLGLSSRWVRTGVTTALGSGLTLGGTVTLRKADYDREFRPFTPAGETRSDTTRTLRLTAHHRGFRLGRFSPQFSLGREIRTSNAQLHDYKRTFGEVSFVQQF
ncbi:MAG: surface lipoprotein assembly modifier [Paracoccaceae bacterium]|nr:surface lipoprotein assembly modifier [Paracoccaceae bacterium]